MSCPSIVRLATPNDATELWRLTLQANKENALRTLAPERINWMMNRALYPELIPLGDMGPRGVIGVIGQEGALEGLVFLLIGQFWYSNEKHLEELIVFVDPMHRRSHHAKAMIRWMKQQVDYTGLPLLTGVLSRENVDRKLALYKRLLGDPIGAFFFVTPKGTSLPLAVAASS